MKKRYRDIIAISYPMSNINYIRQLNDRVLEEKGEEPTHIFKHDLLEPETVEIMAVAGIFNRPNKEL